MQVAPSKCPQHEIYIKGLHPKLFGTQTPRSKTPYIAMASYRNIVLIALFFIATTPRTHGIILSNVVQVNVAGLLSCVVPGTLPTLTSPPLSGVTVVFTCNGGTIILGQAVTNTTGFVSAVFKLVDSVVFDSSTCVGTINLSNAASCSLFPPTGTVGTTLTLLSAVQGVVQFTVGRIFLG
ncbi:hypothetical protein BT93_L3543 [Corymbia citriodora subsp. variegata]|uniref:Phylloplanin n=1 Tax=Corymbia citriodora subsp. variegata TaxID=360336 RepID=A0A8T0CJH9_CORYI|nr:hypothetical protein BT93_L3543 [Corymbia citriodora subsp. variegata]